VVPAGRLAGPFICALRGGAFLERAADTLHGAGIDAELRCDLSHARATGLCQRSLDLRFQLGGDGRTPEPLPFAPSPPQARTNTLLND
jgi:hypothetical protein